MTDEAIRSASGSPGQTSLCVRAKRRHNTNGQELSPHYEVVLNGRPICKSFKAMQDAVDFFAELRIALGLEIKR